MRILAISDTHGHINLINELARKYKADAVLHCGDFGFYEETPEALAATPDRELTLRVHHATGIDPAVRKAAFKMTREEKIETITKEHLLGEFPLFVNGHLKFEVPVYCVPGNHEDVHVVQKLYSGELQVPNLHMLDENSDILLDGWIRLVGVGGNYIHWNFFDRINSDAYYPSMRMSQWCTLYERFVVKPREDSAAILRDQEEELKAVKRKKDKSELKAKHRELNKQREDARDQNETLWVLTHVSPGKIPFMERMGFLLKPKLWFSGHMDPLTPQSYSLFTSFEDWEWESRARRELQVLRCMLLRNMNFAKCGALVGQWKESKENVSENDVVSQWVTNVCKRSGTADTEVIVDAPSDLPRRAEGESTEDYLGKLYAYFCVTRWNAKNEEQWNGATTTADQDAANTATEVQPEQQQFSKVVGNSTVNVGGLATVEEYERIYSVASECLHLPRLPEKPKYWNEGTPDYDPGAIISARQPGELVKGTTFLNLPDSYMGGYIIVDTDPEGKSIQLVTGGSMPPKSIVKETHRQVWERCIPTGQTE